MSEPSIQLLDRLRHFAGAAPERLAVRDSAEQRTLTWSQLDSAVRDFASHLRSQLPRGMLRETSLAPLRIPKGRM